MSTTTTAAAADAEGMEIVLVESVSPVNGFFDCKVLELRRQMQEPQNDMDDCVRAVEDLLNYSFRNRNLLEEALTHASITGAASYQRLEFIGDAALGLAMANYLFLAYPNLDPGQLSLLRAANISTEKLARVAVRHGLYRYVRHNAAALDLKVTKIIGKIFG
ncbi:hypothetical protein Ancab_004456 [Ancistrocladus abbreviatus]